MPLLIDGYNLMYKLPGQFGRGGNLLRRRQALLKLLADRLSAQERCDTIVVFDARRQNNSLPRWECYQQMMVLYSVQHETADELLIELLSRIANPKEVTVVSSDRQIQCAARVHGARWVDADRWLERRKVQNTGRLAPTSGPLLPTESEEQQAVRFLQRSMRLEDWIRYFGLNDAASLVTGSDRELGTRPTGKARVIEKASDSQPRKQTSRKGSPPGPIRPKTAKGARPSAPDLQATSTCERTLETLPSVYSDDPVDRFPTDPCTMEDPFPEGFAAPLRRVKLRKRRP